MGRPAPPARVTELVSLAERVAREAGAQLREAFSGAAVDIQTKSSPTDLVSAADVAAETLIREALLATRPDDGMLGEEGSDTPGTSGLRWIVDPLDGTTNFLFGLPQWGVSMAVEDESGTLAGVAGDPLGELDHFATAGIRSAHGRSCSICAASESSVASSPGRPTSWTASGKPSGVKPIGTDAAGWPEWLKGAQ